MPEPKKRLRIDWLQVGFFSLFIGIQAGMMALLPISCAFVAPIVAFIVCKFAVVEYRIWQLRRKWKKES